MLLLHQDFWLYFSAIGILFFSTIFWLWLRIRKVIKDHQFQILNIFIVSFFVIFLCARLWVLAISPDKRHEINSLFNFFGFESEGKALTFDLDGFALPGAAIGFFLYYLTVFNILGSKWKCSSVYFFDQIAPCFFIFFTTISLGKIIAKQDIKIVIFLLLEFIFHIFWFVVLKMISYLFKVDSTLQLTADPEWDAKRTSIIGALKHTHFWQLRFWKLHWIHNTYLEDFWRKNKNFPLSDRYLAPHPAFQKVPFIFTPLKIDAKLSFWRRLFLWPSFFKKDSIDLTKHFNPLNIKFFYVGTIASLELAWFFGVDFIFLFLKTSNSDLNDAFSSYEANFLVIIPSLFFTLFGAMAVFWFQIISPRHLRRRDYFYETQY